ncbi:MAG: NAD(P)H nitroreductase [Ruminococcaceae bacterium]|nr:NAD(P)H nitroreductase [Oscillospiraceae bacterium]
MNEAIRNLLERRSVRSYTAQPVSREDLETIVKVGYHSPSGVNRQTWHFTVISNREKLDRLAAVMRESLGLAENYCFYQAPVLIIVSNLKPETSLPGADSACALTNMFNAAHALGLGSVWINQVNDGCKHPAVRALLTEYGVPADHVVYGSAAIGHPAADLPARAQKNPNVVTWVD